ncbi:MAG: heme exporter protein CcmD [Cellvibrionaceae bacterium]
MNFQFESLQDFLHMSGHGFYVWMCFLLTFGLMLYLVLAPEIRIRQFIKQQRRIEQRLTSARVESELKGS